MLKFSINEEKTNILGINPKNGGRPIKFPIINVKFNGLIIEFFFKNIWNKKFIFIFSNDLYNNKFIKV